MDLPPPLDDEFDDDDGGFGDFGTVATPLSPTSAPSLPLTQSSAPTITLVSGSSESFSPRFTPPPIEESDYIGNGEEHMLPNETKPSTMCPTDISFSSAGEIGRLCMPNSFDSILMFAPSMLRSGDAQPIHCRCFAFHYCYLCSI